ncbi:MAG: phosphate-starvation-inducible PsiE family protein [Methylococcales bacterium]|nr:phosphate-starvation-inducible PsiE family protein [Methylococcales bacterium]
MRPERLNELRDIYRNWVDELGSLLIEAFHYLALFVIGASIVWSAVVAYGGMMLQGHATLGDILLLFIYLEFGAMVGIYFKTSVMPVTCLIYIAITALSRMLIGDIQAHHHIDNGILLVSVSILLLAISTRILRKPPFSDN